jgi:hypothetical protein
MFAGNTLDEVERWLEEVMPDISDPETLRISYVAWLHKRGHEFGLEESLLSAYDFASQAQMGASGLFRYWHKVRMGD